MNFCCGVTLFNPSKNELNSILKYLQVFKLVYVYDNTEGKESLVNKRFFNEYKNIVYFSNGQNMGLSYAYNVVCREAIQNGFKYICIFDQDSNINILNLNYMIECISRNNDSKVAIYTPKIIYHHIKNQEDFKNQNEAMLEIEWAISSGSFINLEVYHKHNLEFDENYFIDRLDYDYCISVKNLGYKIIQIENVCLYQTLGEVRRTIFGTVSQHNALRHYYIFRNRLYMHKKMNKSRLKLIISSIRHILSIILLEENKIEKIKYVYKGYSDFKQNRMKKII